MNEAGANCEYEDSDLDERYLAGKLSNAEAEKFEQHYFECDACWQRVHQGSEIAAAFKRTPVITIESRVTAKTSRRQTARWAVPLAAAAAALFAVGIWRSRGPSESVQPGEFPADTSQTMRGFGRSITVSSNISGSMLIAAWPRTESASSYRVRLLSADGALLYERETADTSVVLPEDSVATVKQTGKQTAYWEIQALSELRTVIAASVLTPTSLSGAQR